MASQGMRRSAVWLCVLLSAGSADASGRDCTASLAPAVSEVYPRTREVPQNLLRFYIYFDREMDRDSAHGEIHIRRTSGEVLDGVFLPTRYALWSQNGTRLTLLLDPGRVKSGLASRAAAGPALLVGRRYDLVIGTGLTSAAGCRLSAPQYHPFVVTWSDVYLPDPEAWTVAAPRASTRQPVRLVFSESLDHLSLAYRIRVRAPDGALVAGRIALGEREREWMFHPQRHWQRGQYQIVVDPRLEDLAGNRPTGLFDDPTGHSRSRQATATPTIISFAVDRDSRR